ncbi:DUF4352 domain-containing protein [Sulfuracidifex tepidarius]|uniref:Uncharacterized protein n=1 Tax=Sulfuracidifex tepidarius TaxID=1294262 RepID=A0A510E0E4_9CREN|nr:DUF4352 domain-containing protein [Sulfuracidifex tepidarius]BBG25965.1 hypothetical protein IC007_0470 [Sulfuracidifex tepidarius]
MNKIVPILIVVVIIIVAVAGFLVLFSGKASPATSSSTSPSPSSSSPAPVSSSGISMTVREENLTPFVLYHGDDQQGYAVFLKVYNNLGSTIYLNASDFFLVTSGGVENVSYLGATLLLGPGAGVNYFLNSFSTEVLPHQYANMTLPFLTPLGSVPQKVELQYEGHTVSAGFPSPVAYGSAVETTNINVSGQSKDLSLASDSTPNEEYGFSGQDLRVYFLIDNSGLSPFPVSGLQVHPPFTLVSDNASGETVPACTTDYFEATVKLPAEAYFGPLDLTVVEGTPHFISLTVDNYSVDTAYAEEFQYTGFTYLLFNVSSTYSGPGEFCLTPSDFSLVTDEGTYESSYSTPASSIFHYMSSVDLVSGETSYGYVAFKVPVGAKPMEIEYISSGQTQGTVKVNLTPSTVTTVEGVDVNSTSQVTAYLVNYPTGDYLDGQTVNVSVSLDCDSPFTVEHVNVYSPFTLISEGQTSPQETSSGYVLNTWVLVKVSNVSYYGYIYLTFVTETQS